MIIYKSTLDANGYITRKEIAATDVPRTAKVHTQLITPGHSYLRVPLSRLRKLGITRAISNCSYISRTEASLEEDIDAGIYIDALLDAGEAFYSKFKIVNSANTGMRCYHPYFAETVIKVGSTIIMNNDKHTVSKMNRYGIVVTNQYGHQSRCTTRNFLSLVEPDAIPSFIAVHSERGALVAFDFDDNPVFTGDDKPCSPFVKCFTDKASYDYYFKNSLKRQTIKTTLTLTQVEHDAWLDSRGAHIDTVVRAGVKPWVLEDRYYNGKFNPVSTYFKNNTYTTCYNKEHDGTRLDHTIIMPGNMIVVPDQAVSCLSYLSNNLIRIDNTCYLPERLKYRYITALQDNGFSYFERTIYHKNPLWLDGVKEKAA